MGASVQTHETASVVPLRPPGEALQALAGGPLTKRFCAWRGQSERRYVTTIFPLDRTMDRCGLPEFEAFVLIAVAAGPAGRHILDVASIERGGDTPRAIAEGLAAGADEWHVHLIAGDRRARAAVAGDLRGRHCDTAMAASA